MSGKGKTQKDLKEFAESLGYKNRKQVMDILELGGLGTEFKPSLWDDYVSLLVVHAKRVEQLVWKASGNDFSVKDDADPCPVCGAEVLSSPGGAWRCSIGGDLHYNWVQANKMLLSIGVKPVDYSVLVKRREESDARSAVVHKYYWRAIFDRLTEEEWKEFEDAYGKVR